jgi:predicted amidohydrolase
VKVGLAQFRSNDDVDDNLRRHIEVMRDAAAQGCSLVVFPELSLTGYWPSRASALAMRPDSAPLQALAAATSDLGITAAVGAPSRTATGVQIGMFIASPDGEVSVYGKQRLHADELPFFVAGTVVHDLRVGGHHVAPAICYESLFDVHVSAAVERGASVYAASVAKPAAAIARARDHYRDVSARFDICVLVVNAVGPNEDLVAAGQSAVWAPGGALQAEAADAETLLVVDVA